ncbi:MAG: hypothetical protein ACFFCO_03830 [Promethearchaeota archaeon]
MKSSSTIPAEKVTVGGLAIQLDPYFFRKLVEQEELTVIHGTRGFFTRWHIYIALNQGLTFYTKSLQPLDFLKIDVEAEKLVSYISL